MPDPLAAARRDQSAQARLLAADKRDAIANARDLVAITRDHAAEARHLALVQRDATAEHDADERQVTGAEIIILAAGKRKRAARLRARAAEQNALAAEDRRDAAEDRERAAFERLYALVDRELLAQELVLTATDPLTGARTRAAGLTELDREIDRCRRAGALLVVAYIDVVGLKAINDSEGHRAGDELLKHAVTLVRGHVRSYDLVIRVGGDEFLCAMSNMTLLDARRRFTEVAAALAAAPRVGQIRVGLAQLTADESAGELIARADGELLGSPHGRH